jgi:triacylglycerol lipase
MAPLARAARERGYRVLNLGYPSRARPVAELAAEVAACIGGFAAGSRLDFITHSMGAIVLRAAVAAGALPLDRVRRVVMLAPPNRGSELPDRFLATPALSRLYRAALGPAGAELGTHDGSVPLALPDPAFEFGVIAGSRSLNPLFSAVVEGVNDGKVSVERASHPAMRAMIVVPHSHSFLMRAPGVIGQCFHFLERGSFASES